MNMPLFNNGSACRDRQWLLPWLGVAIICLFLFQNYVSMVSYIAYSYLYWVKPSIHYVNKGSVQDADQLPVPKLLHQTWKDKNVPEQWRNAQQSCISRHKDYTYKLWTDEDGLDLIKVRASRNLACLSRVSIQASGYFSIQLPRLYHPNEFF